MDPSCCSGRLPTAFPSPELILITINLNDFIFPYRLHLTCLDKRKSDEMKLDLFFLETFLNFNHHQLDSFDF